jgi:hypothetical protein
MCRHAGCSVHARLRTAVARPAERLAGQGFCYNVGRGFTALFPTLVDAVPPNLASASPSAATRCPSSQRYPRPKTSGQEPHALAE